MPCGGRWRPMSRADIAGWPGGTSAAPRDSGRRGAGPVWMGRCKSPAHGGSFLPAASADDPPMSSHVVQEHHSSGGQEENARPLLRPYSRPVAILHQCPLKASARRAAPHGYARPGRGCDDEAPDPLALVQPVAVLGSPPAGSRNLGLGQADRPDAVGGGPLGPHVMMTVVGIRRGNRLNARLTPALPSIDAAIRPCPPLEGVVVPGRSGYRRRSYGRRPLHYAARHRRRQSTFSTQNEPKEGDMDGALADVSADFLRFHRRQAVPRDAGFRFHLLPGRRFILLRNRFFRTRHLTGLGGHVGLRLQRRLLLHGIGIEAGRCVLLSVRNLRRGRAPPRPEP